jgi:uncharacterized protein (DUF2249 family)
MSNKPDITPDTKVGALLDAYPELEDKLIELAPAFAKLRNPVLRKTVAKVATLRQAAQVGGVSLGTIITTLRKCAGLNAASIGDTTVDSSATPPSWFSPEKIAKTLDARPMLAAGQHPITIVMKDLDTLPAGAIYELITPFVPAPLLDMAKQKGYESWSVTEGNDCVRSYLGRT